MNKRQLSPIDGQALLREDERQRCEIWTRVMGYHRPVASFNTGKQGEFQQRLHFQEGQLGQPGQQRAPLTLCR